MLCNISRYRERLGIDNVTPLDTGVNSDHCSRRRERLSQKERFNRELCRSTTIETKVRFDLHTMLFYLDKVACGRRRRSVNKVDLSTSK